MEALRIITPEQVSKIHRAALRILEITGLVIQHGELLGRMMDAGFKVDKSSERVWFLPDLVEDYVRKAPSSFVLASRTGKRDLPLEQGKTYTRSISGSYQLFDPQTKACRVGTPVETAQATRLMDGLENISFCGGVLYPWTEPAPVRDIALLKTMFENTEKHIFFNPYGLKNMEFIVEMMDVVNDDRVNREGSLISVNACPISPLLYPKHELDVLIKAAERRIPIQVGSTPLAGAASPVTLAGQLALMHAEILAAVVMAEVWNAGAPMIYEPRPNPMDMRTGNALWGAVEWGLASAASQQLGSYCGLPTDFSGGTTESKVTDQQAGIEKSLNMMIIGLARPNVISGIGTLETINTTSFEQLVIDDEICARIFRVLRGIEVSDETIAAELIDRIGPGGTFLGEDHTMRHFKGEFIWDTIFDRNMRDEWEKEGARDLVEVAREKADRIIRDHHVAPLSREAGKELDLILRKAKDEMVR
jgi:trimethylamine--corrinoid protein Co-methyltransferase